MTQVNASPPLTQQTLSLTACLPIIWVSFKSPNDGTNCVLEFNYSSMEDNEW